MPQRVTDQRAKEYLVDGVGRRLRILRRGLHNVYNLFSPAAVRPIDPENLDDVQISLHAFVINLYGLFDNLAWAFITARKQRNDVAQFRNLSGLNLRPLAQRVNVHITHMSMSLTSAVSNEGVAIRD
jgi:hypothetical protein